MLKQIKKTTLELRYRILSIVVSFGYVSINIFKCLLFLSSWYKVVRLFLVESEGIFKDDAYFSI